MFLAEAATVEIHQEVNANSGESYSVTTTTVNGVTTTQTTNYAPGEPVVVSASASATGQKIEGDNPISDDLTLAPTNSPSPTPSPTPNDHTNAPRKSFLYSIFQILYSKLINLFHH